MRSTISYRNSPETHCLRGKLAALVAAKHACHMNSDPFLDQVRGVIPSARQLQVRRLRDLIRVAITDDLSAGGVGALLASERDLMIEFEAPRDAIRDALALLADEGIIERRRGIGTAPRQDHYQVTSRLPERGQTLEAHFGIGRLSPRLLFWGWIKAPASIVAKLDGVNPGDDCLCVDYVLLRDGQPSAVVTNYLRAAEGAHISATDFHTDFYQLIEGGGGEVESYDFVLQATNADEQVASLLHVMPGEAVLWFEQVIRNTRGEAIDFAVANFRRETRIEASSMPRVDLMLLVKGSGNSDARRSETELS
jgi:GntR family transcriptional regulator